MVSDDRGATASAGTAAAHGLPFLPSASDARGRQGIAHVLNRSAEAGEVRIVAVDDSGRRYGPLTLLIGANETAHVTSADLENGNADKGLFGATGPGVGDWRLELSSDLDIEALSYVRASDGFVTAMHDVAPSEGTRHRVPLFNAASNFDQESRLRLINPGSAPAEVAITGIDSRGASPGDGVAVTLPAGASLTYTAVELESGRGAGLRGSLGDGAGEWRLNVESEQPLRVMSLVSSPTGHLTNLSTAPSNEARGVHRVPLFPATSDPSGRQGLVRVVNRSDTIGDVRISAFDDTQWEYAPLVLPIGAGETAHFNSNDLEQGNPGKGLSGGTGAGQGDWRLELTSDVDIEVLSYVRAWDGLLTAMHDVVPSEAEGTRHRVAMFDPQDSPEQERVLRLINPGSGSAEVAISGVDTLGRTLGDGVAVTLRAGASRTYTAGGASDRRRRRLAGGARRRDRCMAVDARVRTTGAGDEPAVRSRRASLEPVHGARARSKDAAAGVPDRRPGDARRGDAGGRVPHGGLADRAGQVHPLPQGGRISGGRAELPAAVLPVHGGGPRRAEPGGVRGVDRRIGGGRAGRGSRDLRSEQGAGCGARRRLAVDGGDGRLQEPGAVPGVAGRQRWRRWGSRRRRCSRA